MSKIIIKNLEKSFGDNKVISNFNLDIKNGEFIVLVGPSGVWKINSIKDDLRIRKYRSRRNFCRYKIN